MTSTLRGRTVESIWDWIDVDPSPARAGLALMGLDLSFGSEDPIRLLEAYDVEKQAILSLAIEYELSEYAAYSSREELVEDTSKFHAECWDVFEVVERRWNDGCFRQEKLAVASPTDRAFSEEVARYRDVFSKPDASRFAYIRNFLRPNLRLPFIGGAIDFEDNEVFERFRGR